MQCTDAINNRSFLNAYPLMAKQSRSGENRIICSISDYLKACREKGIYSVRIIHGKGTGILRKIVQSILSKSPIVNSYETTDSSGGGWGATSVVLKNTNSE